MSNTQHTPGPWTVEIDRWHYDTASTVVAGSERPTFPFRELLVQVGGTDVGRQEANTRLIAAAPELYDAAHNAAGVLIACCKPAGGCDDDHAIRHAIKTLEYALSKARGEP